MNPKPLTVALSPHFYGEYTVKNLMSGVILALMPALAAAVYFFGIQAFLVTLVAVVSAVVFEYIIQKFVLKVGVSISDGSAVITGLLLAFNLPCNIPLWMVVIGSMVSIGIAKMAFGGLGKNPFNPALIGRVFLLLSFPVAMTTWPKPLFNRLALADGITGATPLGIFKEGLQAGQTLKELMPQMPSYMDLFLGNKGGSLGEISALALLTGLVFLLWRKIITWHIPATILGTVLLFSGIFWLANPNKYPDPVFQILTGGVMLGAIFMATDYVTSPMTTKGMVIFGVCIGVLTVLIRLFGAYPEGMSFAILIMNAFVPLINRYLKPRRFGEGKNLGS